MMLPHHCNKCERSFTRLDNMKRHMAKFHNQDGSLPHIDYQQQPSTEQQRFQFLHPFTMLVAGPTSCGKSTFVTKALQQSMERMSPPPQRIVWLYKRWQPLYTEIQASVLPKVEFIQGIPIGIEKDTFFNPNIRNLLIVDDLMTISSKDPRITEIFYEGSHHRNLSIIQICQNLYYSKDPTQRRNCHYVVLFKNPVDRQSIMTFGRQMWPHKYKDFMEVYDESTSRPHGYVLVDLKQETDEERRLRPNIFEGTTNTAANIPQNQYEPRVQHSNTMELQMYSCDDCGTMLETVHDLQKHVKQWCPAHQDMRQQSYQQPTNFWKKDDMAHRHANYSTSMGMQPIDDFQEPMKKRRKLDKDEADKYTFLRAIVSQSWNEELDSTQKEYMNEGYSKKEARAKAVNENIKEIRQDLYRKYANLIDFWMSLTDDSFLHQKIMEKVNELYHKDNLSWKDAAQQAIKQYKPLFNSYVMPEYDEDSDSDKANDDEETDEEVEDI